MNPIDFPEANCAFHAPPDMAASQVLTVRAYYGKVTGGSVDGAPLVVTAWSPSPAELAALNAGRPLFLSFLACGLPPHFPSVDFHLASHPA